MADIVVTGAGMCGLLTAMLLDEQGHRVTVVERDPAPPPSSEDAWDDWERRGVNQFRLVHFLMPRFRVEVQERLPDVVEAFDAAGALRFHPMKALPAEVTGGMRPGDERFESITGRRPVIETAVASAAAARSGVEIRRGVAVAGVLTGDSQRDSIPHVTGVRTEDGDDIAADLVVDATGRRSPLPRWLADAGARAPKEQIEDSGFVYFGRHLRSSDGSTPPPFGPLLMPLGSISILTLPCDRGTWGLGVVGVASDAALRSIKDPDRWEKLIGSAPLAAHWLDGEFIDDRVTVMGKLEDRERRFVVDGEPIATGVVAVADSWSCSNPSLGRGVTIGLMQAIAICDALEDHGLDDHHHLAVEFDRVTEDVAPWFRETRWFDRHRLNEATALSQNREYETDDAAWGEWKAFQSGMGAEPDPDHFRAVLDAVMLFRTQADTIALPGMAEKVRELQKRDQADFLGPSREEILAIVA